MAAAGSGALADSGAWGGRGFCGLCFPVLGWCELGWVRDGGKKPAVGVCVLKNKGCFWRAKASLFGRERVAAFLVGDLGCANRDEDGAEFRLDAAVPRPGDLSVSRRITHSLTHSLVTCQPSLVVTRNFLCVWPQQVSDAYCRRLLSLLLHFLLQLQLLLLMPGGDLQARGPTLIIVGKGMDDDRHQTSISSSSSMHLHVYVAF